MTLLPIAVAYSFLGFWIFICLRPDVSSLHTIPHLVSCVLLVDALTALTGTLDPQEDTPTQLIRISLLIAVTLLLIEITQAFTVVWRQNVLKKAVIAVFVAQIVANLVFGEMMEKSSVIMVFMEANILEGFIVLGCLVWHAYLRGEMKDTKKLKTRIAVDRVRIFVQSYWGGARLLPRDEAVVEEEHAEQLLP